MIEHTILLASILLRNNPKAMNIPDGLHVRKRAKMMATNYEVEVLRMITEANPAKIIYNNSSIWLCGLAHVWPCWTIFVRYIHTMIPELLYTTVNESNCTPLYEAVLCHMNNPNFICRAVVSSVMILDDDIDNFLHSPARTFHDLLDTTQASTGHPSQNTQSDKLETVLIMQ